MKRVVLMGAGHAHALVLQAIRHTPLRNAEILVISPQPRAPYSGMIPGWLAGRYTLDEICIDFEQLCKAAGAHWRRGELYALDPDNKRLQLTDGVSIDYDVLSLNVGSTLYPPNPAMVAMRPLQNLIERYQHLLTTWQSSAKNMPNRLTVVGGGPAGFETLLAVRSRLLSLAPSLSLETTLVTQSRKVLPSCAPIARWLAQKALKNATVKVQCATRWADTAPISDDELVLWAAGAQAHTWQRDQNRRGSLDVNEQGFVHVNAQLRSTSHPAIFAAGDCAALTHAVPKAGVYAVRMGAVLAHNLAAECSGKHPTTYSPQENHLTLLNTSNGSTIASRGLLAASGPWAMSWKDRIDREFIRQFEPDLTRT
ncbi:FAD-dependent oxidoreductase [Alcaligenes sp.]|uniref:FAD-dependent oxidoreductase n=1 Tax=Alcaligenes sp. TaxID=512 RepID=UPI003D06A368